MSDVEKTERDGARQPQTITAYEIYSQEDMPLRPAPISRPWMDETQKRFAYRCLPMTIANQAGWVVGCPCNFVASWNGGPEVTDTVFSFEDSPPDKRVGSVFGHGVITFNMPYLFRTPTAVNLWVKGPSNWPKHGLYPLEGLVETDWTSASFTMNWKITRANEMVKFRRGEPCCMVVPYPRGFVESFAAERLQLEANPEISAEYQRWSTDRSVYQSRVADGDQQAIRQGWQKDYFQGRDPGKERVVEHQTKLDVQEFTPPK